MTQEKNTLVLATRGSPLAMSQSQWVAQAIEAKLPHIRVTLKTVTTQGDIILDRPLREVGGKGLFTTAVEQVLLDGQADVAVHSLKDMDSHGPDGLSIVAFPKREDPRDVLVTPSGQGVETLGDHAVIGTGALRRVAQLRHIKPTFDLRALRGNINSRLEKLDSGTFGALVLAAAGLHRGGLSHRIGDGLLTTQQLVPAPGQGILAVQMPSDHPKRDVVAQAVDHASTRLQATAERAFLAAIGGNCHSPVGAHCEQLGQDGPWRLSAYLAPTALGENNALPSTGMLDQAWRAHLLFDGNLGHQAFADAGQKLADQAKREAPHIFADWQSR